MPSKDKEKITAYMKEYRKTPAFKMSNMISNWKFLGVIETEQYTYEELYYAFCSQGYCEECGVKFSSKSNTKTDKCLDHDHETGEFRDILCRSCNVKRG